MAIRVKNEPLLDLLGEQVTANGNPLTTGANRRSINIPFGTREVLMEVSGGQDARVALVRRIRRVYHFDASRSGAAQWRDLLAEGTTEKALIDNEQTNSTGFTLAAADFLYIQTAGRVGGYRFLIPTTANNNAATTTFEYSTRAGFVATADTDGTDSGGAMFAQTGNLEIDTVPAAGVWAPIDLQTIVPTYPISGELGHWARIQPSAALDAVVVTQLSPLQWDIADTTAKWHAGKFKTVTEYTMDLHPDVGALEFASAHASTTTTIEFTWVFP